MSLALGLASACGSSSPKGSTIDQSARGAGGKGGLDGSTGSGGESSLFGKDGGLMSIDSSVPLIDEDASCGASTIVAAPRKVSILLVVDESASMTDEPAGFGVDKWSALKSAMKSALTPVANRLSFGLELFPYKAPTGEDGGAGASSCEMPTGPGLNVPVGAGKTTVPEILAALDDTAPGGGTPTAAALKRAYDYFKTGAGSKIDGDRYVLLATDGGPNCNAAHSCDYKSCTTNMDGLCPLDKNGNCCDATFGGTEAMSRCLDADGTKTQVDQLRSLGVKTIVVGIPGTEAYASSLDAFAAAGGQENPAAPPKYFAVTASGGASGLTDVLSSITQSLVKTCRLELTSVPPDPTKLNVSIDGKLVPKNADGWTLDTTTTPPTVELLGATCTKVEAEGAQSAKIVYGCPTLIR